MGVRLALHHSREVTSGGHQSKSMKFSRNSRLPRGAAKEGWRGRLEAFADDGRLSSQGAGKPRKIPRGYFPLPSELRFDHTDAEARVLGYFFEREFLTYPRRV